MESVAQHWWPSRARLERAALQEGAEGAQEQGEQGEQMEQSPVVRVVKRVHTRLLSPKVELTQKELDTLDGNIRQLSGEDAIEALFP